MKNNICNVIVIFIFLFLKQFVHGREVVPFNDGWSFKKGPFPDRADILNQNITDGKWQKITIPHTWNAGDMQREIVNASAFRNPQDRFYTGEAVYKKKL